MNDLKWSNLKKSFQELTWYEWAMCAVMVLIAAWAMVKSFYAGAVDGNPPWLTVVNFISALCGVVCIFFCAKANISTFIFAIINTFTYAVYLLYWHIWGTACLELLFYLPMNIASWYLWAKHRDAQLTQKTKAKKLTVMSNVWCACFVLGTGYIYHNILVQLGGEVAWFDAFTLSIGIVATILTMLRYREQYIWWIIADVIAVGMFIAHFDAVYLTKKTIYLIMAVIGLMNWTRLHKQRNAVNE